MFLALLPLSLAPLELSPALLWRLAAAILVTFCVGHALFGETQVRLVRRNSPELYSLTTRAIYSSIFAAIVGLQLLVLARPTDLGPSFYVLGLLGLLLTAAIQFVRILFVRPQR